MKKYERNISFKTIYQTIARRFVMIISIFSLIFFASFVITNFLLVKTYASSASLFKGSTISSIQYSTMQSYVSDTSNSEDKPGAIYTTFLNLKEKNIKYSNGNEITINDIKSGLSFSPLVSNSVFFTFSFQSTDQSIAQSVLKELSEVSTDYIKTRGGADYTNLIVYSPASSAKKNSSETKYFIISLVVGAILAFGVPFVYEIIADEVYDRRDIEYLGSPAFELEASKKKNT